MKIAINDLKAKITELLTANFSPEQAEKITEYLLWAEMSGNKTMGVIKMTGTEPLQNIVPDGEMTVERETKLSKLINAAKNPAPLAAQEAVEVAIQKAKEHGFGLVGVRNTFSSNGAQAFYVEKIAKENLIGVMCSRSPASTAGFGSIDPVFGTNPIGFGFPTANEPLVFDAATSAMTFYGLILAKARGEKIPENMAIDKDGNPTTDPAEAMSGALLPFDRGYKGSGFGMVVEMLAGPLVGGAWIDNKTFGEEWGNLVLAIDPGLLVDVDTFKANASDLVAKLKAARKKEGVQEIRLPGEQARKNYDTALANGYVDIDDTVLRQLGIS
ncbi:MAG: Ldh family oxidoreductase [Candidatus Saccharimonadales bacterium]